MNIFEWIDTIGEKFKYDIKLIDALKKCVPAMVQGKSQEDIKLLMDTLERVQIFIFEDKPKQEDLDDIKKEKLNGRNEHVKDTEYDKGEYGKEVAPGAYITEPIFDDNMNIIDRIGFIYLTNLYNGGETAKYYGTDINLSHLIHELGHAWASQKDEYEQDENGNYTISVGASRFHCLVNRKTHTVETIEIDGLYIEEALNSINEEKALYRLLGIQNYNDIPGYVPSTYQGLMTALMRDYIEKLGENVFERMRIQKDIKGLESFQHIFEKTDSMKKIQTEEYRINKEKELNSAQNTSMSEQSKKKVKDFFDKYEDLYLSPRRHKNFVNNLDSVMEQLFNFKEIQYNYNINQEDTAEAYKQTLISILAEGYAPLNEMCKIISQGKSNPANHQENKEESR